MTYDVEPGFAAHEFGGVEGNVPGIVGDEAQVVGAAQFNQGDRPARAFLNDFDAAGLRLVYRHSDSCPDENGRDGAAEAKESS